MSIHQGGGVGALRLLPLCLSLTTIFSTCTAHMKMSYPLPLGDPALGGSDPDYDETSPLQPSGSDYPCKGHAGADWIPQASWTAGQTYNMSIGGGSPHKGGSCQLSLSYDGQIFRVIKSIIGGCPLASIYDFVIPPGAPSGTALFAWTWQNEVGNREFYMNCAAVKIQGAAPARLARRMEALSDLPQIWVANIAGINSCTTTEGTDPVYPAPGCNVEYGGKYDANSPPDATSNPGECDFGSSQPVCPATGPAEDRAQNPGMAMAEMPVSSSSVSTLSLSTVTDFGSSSTSSVSMMRLTTITDFGPSSSTSVSLMRLTTITDYALSVSASSVANNPPEFIGPVDGGPLAEQGSPDGGPAVIAPLFGGPLAIQGPERPTSACPADVIVTATAPARIVPPSRSSGFSTAPCYPNITVTKTAPAYTLTMSPTGRPYPPPSRSRTPSPQPPYPSVVPSADAEYVGADVMAYMPCEPGSFLCSDASTFWTCDQTTDPGQRWVWQYPRAVAAGMMCQPQLVACAPGSEGCSTGTGRVPAGYLREDQYVRAT